MRIKFYRRSSEQEIANGDESNGGLPELIIGTINFQEWNQDQISSARFFCFVPPN